jgi:erythromycin esterase-like protein
MPFFANLDEWISRETVCCSLDSPDTIDAAVDRMVIALGNSIKLLGFGEALHGGEEILLFRNRLFQRLATKHGYSAIAIESSLPRARLVDEYVAGRGATSYDQVRETGFGNGFGDLEANRDLVEWMRRTNADRAVKLRFYGFDIPTLAAGIASPSQAVRLVLDYLGVDAERRQRIEKLLGSDADWENPAQYMDPSKSIGNSPAAQSLRIEVEELLSEMRMRAPELTDQNPDRYVAALHDAVVARQLLTFHAAMARKAGFAVTLGIRDLSMADNLGYIVNRERGRGKVFVFAHNAHLQRGERTSWPTWQKALNTESFSWWPAGAYMGRRFGRRYAVIGSGVGASEANGISPPDAGTLEARLAATPGAARFIPTYQGQGLPVAETAALPACFGSTKNLSYIPLTAESFTDFDWLAVFNSVTYNRGGRPLL